MQVIDKFFGAYRFLSNFWPAVVVLDGEEYPSVEHAYVAAKTTDKTVREKVRKTASASAVKKLGREIQIREDWDDIRLSTMADLIEQKFTHSNLKNLLLETGDAELIEGNTWGDVFWGVCRGKGENNLGKILMKVRDDLKSK